ncbi:alanyl-tRNA editing protein [Heliobacterium gestii]|uniref:Alanyl-tRNA editing protein n=1 Tax=Heliomicrobium gestii TaxID=2699 RepID=A0A845LBI9_HELGE|nr:alanyl-tRNA editing protein [Heliomicrobium gestii]MBM7867638.1 Ser-tRNA(Ala) deacylase AlaX [Heliomicrobium gestii]MZP44032.1 alanyl-tRNA editing protein [Heliomicrobium gestii]
MSVKKMFWIDPYRSELSAKITSVEGNIITLDRTIVYAFSGGQASDSGTINGYQIIEARKTGKEVLYTIEPNHNLQPDCEVELKIDWNKRYKIMKLHFAAEIILELVYQNFNHPKKIGANITEEKARLDFEWKGNISEAFPILEEKARVIIRSNYDIISDFSDEENEERYWEIEGFAKVPCGGTHIKKTGEIGDILLKRGKRLGSNKERIEIYLQS